MAINKMRTSPAMKVGVVILIIAFVSGIGVIGIGALSGGSTGSSPQQQTGTNQQATQLQQVSQTALAQISPLEAQLKTKSNDYDTLKALGDAYYDYAQKVAEAAPGAAVDITIWRQSVDYYKRAVAVKPGDPSVATDMSIAQFYAGDVQGAIATIEPVRKANPKFGPAVYNAGVFYKNDNQPGKAIAAFQEYLKLEPNGQSAASAKQLLSEVQSGGQQAPSTSASGTGQ